jgi:hypothetical protein
MRSLADNVCIKLLTHLRDNQRSPLAAKLSLGGLSMLIQCIASQAIERSMLRHAILRNADGTAAGPLGELLDRLD